MRELHDLAKESATLAQSLGRSAFDDPLWKTVAAPLVNRFAAIAEQVAQATKQEGPNIWERLRFDIAPSQQLAQSTIAELVIRAGPGSLASIFPAPDWRLYGDSLFVGSEARLCCGYSLEEERRPFVSIEFEARGFAVLRGWRDYLSKGEGAGRRTLEQMCAILPLLS